MYKVSDPFLFFAAYREHASVNIRLHRVTSGYIGNIMNIINVIILFG